LGSGAAIPTKRVAVTEGGSEEGAKRSRMSVDKAAAAAAKAKGNGCLTSGDFQGAIDAYTEAIGHDPNDKVFYSNRSAAYASMKNFEKALEDGNKCVELEPSFAKGYGRAGAALHGMGQYEEAVEIYNKGLEVDPSSAQLKQGLEAAKSAAASVGANPIAQLFSNPENLQKLAMNPTTMAFLQQPDFVQKCDACPSISYPVRPRQMRTLAHATVRSSAAESRRSHRTRQK
jgi:tetratricopeptide (TPR) repeat protein